MKYKHKWKKRINTSSMYDTAYRCTRCNSHHTVSIDSIESALPEYGCHYPAQSDLQKLNSMTNWAIHFLLREFPMHYATKLNLSTDSMWYIEMYNNSVRDLRAKLKSQYKINRSNILYARKRKEREDDKNKGS